MQKYVKYFIVSWIVIIFVFHLIVTISLFRSKSSLEKANTSLQNKLEQEMTVPTLSANAVKVSECVPYMGQHWVAPEHIPNGPFYLVDKGKILGIEFMFGLDEIPGQQLANMTKEQFAEYLAKNNLSLGDVLKSTFQKYDLQSLKYRNFSFEWSSPHAGQPRPHYDIHFYLATPQELTSVCPNAKMQDIVTPEVIENVQKYDIPFPGINEPTTPKTSPAPTKSTATQP